MLGLELDPFADEGLDHVPSDFRQSRIGQPLQANGDVGLGPDLGVHRGVLGIKLDPILAQEVPDGVLPFGILDVREDLDKPLLAEDRVADELGTSAIRM